MASRGEGEVAEVFNSLALIGFPVFYVRASLI